MNKLEYPIHVRGAMRIDGKQEKGLTIVGTSTLHGYPKAKIVTGKATKPDSLSFSAGRIDEQGKRQVNCQRLFRGHYADAVVDGEELVAALRKAGAIEEAKELEQLMVEWNK